MNVDQFKKVFRVDNRRKLFVNIWEGIRAEESFKRLENFSSKSFVLIYPSFQHYIDGRRDNRRIAIALFIKFTALLTTIRFGISLIVGTPYILRLTSDANHVLGNRLIISSVLCFGSFICDIMIGLFIEMRLEIKGKYYVLNYLSDIKNRVNSNQLNSTFAKKYFKQLNFITKLLSINSLCLVSFGASLVFCLPPIIAYFDTNSEIKYSLISILFWNSITMIWLFDFYAVIFSTFQLFYLSVIYIKYQFLEVEQQMIESIVGQDFMALQKSLVRHNSICVSTAKLNQVNKNLILVLYKFAKPALNLLIYVSFAPDSSFITRIASITIFSIIFIVIFVMNLMSGSVSSAAHKPLKGVYKVFKSENLMPIEFRMKFMGFIEKLKESTIGFYCYDFFPMNNYEFYQYLCGWAYNYFLIMNVLRDYNFI